MPEPYLVQLAVQLAEGLGRLPAERRAQHVDYLLASQNPDGGFSGREGDSDLYYTGFGLRGLAVLDALSPDVCDRSAQYLQSCLQSQTSLVDFFSLIYSAFLVQLAGGSDVFAASPPDWSDRIAELLSQYRTADGGYAKALGSPSGSTYHTFLVGLCFELLGKPLPQAEEAVRFILSRRREDGGFVEIAPMKRSGTNPTAAAIGLLRMIDGPGVDGTSLTAEVQQAAIDFLVDMPSIEGGFRANGRAPLADLLSTFTGLWTLQALGAFDRVNLAAKKQYVAMVELPSGGFRGGLWDEQTDVEYTFYGLGCLGLLTGPAEGDNDE